MVRTVVGVQWPHPIGLQLLEAEQHFADGVVLRIVQATVTQQPSFQIVSVLDYRSWINCRQRYRLKQCLGRHQAQYDIGVQSASSSSAILVRTAMYVWNRCTNAAPTVASLYQTNNRPSSDVGGKQRPVVAIRHHDTPEP